MKVKHTHSSGFTIVEILVTVVLAGLFLTFFIQMYRASSSQQTSIARQSIANDIAKSNLNKFVVSTDISPAYVCDTNTSSTANTNNLAINPNAVGTVLLDNNSANKETVDTSLFNATQEVRAYSPIGCLASSSPIKIESKVTYGQSDQRGEATYATYIR